MLSGKPEPRVRQLGAKKMTDEKIVSCSSTCIICRQFIVFLFVMICWNCRWVFWFFFFLRVYACSCVGNTCTAVVDLIWSQSRPDQQGWHATLCCRADLSAHKQQRSCEGRDSAPLSQHPTPSDLGHLTGLCVRLSSSFFLLPQSWMQSTGGWWGSQWKRCDECVLGRSNIPRL